MYCLIIIECVGNGDPDGSRITSRQAASSRKRHIESDEPATESRKKLGLNPPQSPVQTMYRHTSSLKSLKVTVRMTKGGIGLICRHIHPCIEVWTAPTSKQITHIAKDGVKSVDRNRVSVEFSNAQAANDFLTNQILTLTKFKAVIPIFNTTRMGLVRGVPVDLSMEDIVESLELPIGCGEVLKARRLHRKNIIEGTDEWVPTHS
ncbi:unnamed protein product, partial [Leptidea sinapis]